MKAPKEIIHRSGCPVSYTLDFFGDKWTLLILRDMMFAGKTSYGEFLRSDEKIATNILADRLLMLETNGFLTKSVAIENRSRFHYALTEKGIGLLPIIFEMTIWGSKFSATPANQELLDVLRTDKEKTVRKFSKMLMKRIRA